MEDDDCFHFAAAAVLALGPSKRANLSRQSNTSIGGTTLGAVNATSYQAVTTIADALDELKHTGSHPKESQADFPASASLFSGHDDEELGGVSKLHGTAVNLSANTDVTYGTDDLSTDDFFGKS